MKVAEAQARRSSRMLEERGSGGFKTRLTVCATGSFPVSATGARPSRSCTATSAAQLPVPGGAAPRRAALRRRLHAGRHSRPLQKHAGFMNTAPARCCGGARHARSPIRWTRSSARAGTSCAIPTTSNDKEAVESASGSTRCCPWINTSAARSTPACICSMRASSPRRSATWGISTLTSPSCALVHQGTILGPDGDKHEQIARQRRVPGRLR